MQYDLGNNKIKKSACTHRFNDLLYACAKLNSACIYVKMNAVNSLEKLQDGRDHLCDGLHGEILVTKQETRMILI